MIDLMWHFSTPDCRLRYDDRRLIEVGKTLVVTGLPVLCHYGLHASRRIIDALQNAPGDHIWRVKLGGRVEHGADKSVGTERTALWGFNAEKVLKQFSRDVALDAIEKVWDKKKFGEFPPLVREWLKTGDESLRSAAESAAWSAAKSAAESAAWSAARSAAKSAAESAAESAAWSAARSAAKSAAESAAWSAAWSAAESAAWSAAESAAESAARSAAKSAQDKQLSDAVLHEYARIEKEAK